MKEKVKAIAVQMPIPDEADRDGNLATAVRLLEEAGARRPDLVCLPELFAGLKAHSRLDGPETRAVAQVARRHSMYIVAPLYIEEGGAVYNCSVLIDRQGQAAGCYRKVHLWPWEAPVFGVKAGDSFPVFQTDFGSLGLCICHDHQFPETARAMTLGGAEVLHCATRMPDPFQLPWLQFSLVRSLENQLYVISVGNSSNESSTHIVAPRFRGALLAACGPGTHLVEAELDLDWLRRQRQASPLYRYPKEVPNRECEDRLRETESHCFLRERRPETYGALGR